ncbi:MAG: helix-turn-helix domain-containing protein [Bacteroidales bacterium]
MLARIQQLMVDKGLNLSTFADEIGVKRTTMTHTMSGRNNPSLDIVSKILERYNDISSDWLIFGRGVKYKSNAPIQQALFEDMPVTEKEAIQVVAQNGDMNEALPSTPLPILGLQLDNNVQKNSKRIDRIMIFYSDKSFETFIPENEDKK